VGRSDFSVAGSPAFASVHNHLEGAAVGAQVGFNWQTGWIVFGLETDFQAAGIKGGLNAPPCPAPVCGVAVTATYDQRVPWFGSVRGRIGVANGGWFFYATGGYAYARLETNASATAGAVSATFTDNETRHGWAAGGGIEVALAPQWSAKLEYLHLDFGSAATTWTLPGLPSITDDARLAMSVVRAGINFRF
jgi:outer membrane immunogenic protein